MPKHDHDCDSNCCLLVFDQLFQPDNMERNTNNDWFNGIARPVDSTLAESVNYLDQLLGGGYGPRGQLLPQRTKQKSKPTIQQRRQFENRSNNVTKPAQVALDDTKWIEERKKKFPRAANLTSSPVAEPRFGGPSPPSAPMTLDDSGLTDSRATPGSRVSQRKRTLFEKLMDSN